MKSNRPEPASKLELMTMERDGWRKEALARREQMEELTAIINKVNGWFARYERWRTEYKAEGKHYTAEQVQRILNYGRLEGSPASAEQIAADLKEKGKL